MELQNIKKMLASPFETDRIKMIYYAVKNKRVDLLELIKKNAESDESVNVRYYADKACDYFSELLKEREREKELEKEIEKKKNARAVIQEKIIQLINSSAAEDRILASKAIVKIKLNFLWNLVVKKIDEETDEIVLCAFIKALGNSKDKSYTPVLFKYFRHPDIEVVLSAIEAVAQLEDIRAFPYIICVLYSCRGENEAVTAAITGYLTGYTPEKIHLFLVEMLDYSSDSMIESALGVISAFKCKKSLEYVERFCAHKNKNISAAAMRAVNEINIGGLSDFDFSVFIAGITEPLDDERKPEELSAKENASDESDKKIDSLREITANPGPNAENVILDFLKNETDSRVLGYAISACRKIPGARNLTLLKKFLSHPDERIRANAIEALGETEGIDLHNILKSFLTDGNNRIRANAIIALKNYPDIDHCALLQEMIDDKNSPLMCVSAIYAIMCIRGDTVALLKPLTRHDSEEIKTRAVSALEFLAGDAKNITAKTILGELNNVSFKNRKTAKYIFNKSSLASNTKINKKNAKFAMSVSAPAAGVYFINRMALFFRAFVHIFLISLACAAFFYLHREFNSNAPKSAINPIGVITNVFKRDSKDIKITLLYTSNLFEIIGQTDSAAENKKTKLKDIIQNERRAAKNAAGIFLLFDLGNYSSGRINSVDNTENVYRALNFFEYDAASFAAKDAIFCFNLLSSQGEKFILPVISSNLTNKSSKEIPAIFKPYHEINFENIIIKIAAVTDLDLISKLPSNLSANYDIIDPVSAVTPIFQNINDSKNVLKILLSSNTTVSSMELISKKIGADIIIDMGHGPETNLLTTYGNISGVRLLPSKVKKNTACIGRFEFIYESSLKTIGELCKWRLNEI